MTAEEFRARWTGHAPKVQDVTGEYAVLVPLVERPEGLCLLYEVRADTLGRQPGQKFRGGGRSLDRSAQTPDRQVQGPARKIE